MLDRAGLRVAEVLARFIEDQALPGTGVTADAFWAGAAAIYARFAPENRALLAVRDRLQHQIDAWHDAHPQPFDPAEYRTFLHEIGYLVAEPPAFQISPA